MGLWDPKWDPKNSGRLERTQTITAYRKRRSRAATSRGLHDLMLHEQEQESLPPAHRDIEYNPNTLTRP